MGTRSSAGRIEPGVTAMAVQGGVIACVDALGNVLVRDFATGTPTAEQVQPYVQPRGPAAEASSQHNPSAADSLSKQVQQEQAATTSGSEAGHEWPSSAPTSRFWRR